MAEHAVLPPSSAVRWMNCAGAPYMEAKAPPDEGSRYADEGTAAHFLAARCLTVNADPVNYFGKKIACWVHPESDSSGCDFLSALVIEGTDTPIDPCLEITNEFTVDEEMVGAIRYYINGVHTMAAGGHLFIEQRLSTEAVTTEPGGFGTSDAVAIVGTTLKVRDLKYGQGDVVEAEGNLQLIIYALSAVDEHSLTYEITDVELSIHQPRVAHDPKVWKLTLAELESYRGRIKERGYHALQALKLENDNTIVHHLNPSAEACKWCRSAKALQCPAQSRAVMEATMAEFEDLTVENVTAAQTRPMPESIALLGAFAAKVDMIRQWCENVESRVIATLHEQSNSQAAIQALGHKLVQGKAGKRAWADPAAAEAMLKTMRLKVEEMYDLSLISPTTAEKLSKPGLDGKPVIGPRQWPKVQALIVRPEGKVTVAKIDDKREPVVIQPVVEQFEDLTAGEEFV